jgi:hypothetical protein
MIAIVSGMIATYPVGGVAWDYAQYALGLDRLGFEVYYIEDSGLPSYHPEPAAYLDKTLRWFSPSLGGRWHYRDVDGQMHGLEQRKLRKIFEECSVFLNVSNGCLLRDDYMPCPRKVLIDSDPGLNHFVNFPKWDLAPGWQGTHGYRGHDYFFTYAENYGSPDCKLPDLGLEWHRTRPVVIPSAWRSAPIKQGWTTIMSWKPYQHYLEPKEGQDALGAKEAEFARCEELPGRTHVSLEIAVAGANAPLERWRGLGWRVRDAAEVSRSAKGYRRYIEQSRGEFSVAKGVYVSSRSGWFSCRSVCYLAAGRPVVVQDTGFSKFIPTGEGLFAFSNLAEAVRSVAAVETDYNRHQRAARGLAKDHFDSNKVLGDLLTKIGL